MLRNEWAANQAMAAGAAALQAIKPAAPASIGASFHKPAPIRAVKPATRAGFVLRKLWS